ncbi:hypothetical protein ILUMI_22699 [Ignelater luminosus]|uniref:Uncharacterized protein n=1 Tax=Ignelater luminosus TaxID=2038154 RepID=A0A8K0CDU2_IGNLU|nr:hypothetical protein ILUMI_22699 [Ignelater luminosus]
MAAVMMLWSFLILLLTVTSTYQQTPSCAYGARGSLTSTCTYAIPSYFRTTSYRFDNLDETVRCVNCILTTIESNTFDISGNQIKTLDLNSSKIVTLKPKAFIGLASLKKLLLKDNQIKSFYLVSGTLKSVAVDCRQDAIYAS